MIQDIQCKVYCHHNDRSSQCLCLIIFTILMQISVYAILKNKENNMSPLLKSGHIIINCNNVYLNQNRTDQISQNQILT